MYREMVTNPLAVEDLWNDLRTNLAQLKELGVTRVNVLFGFFWGLHMYPEGESWNDITASVEDLGSMIRQAHEKGHGELGHDNIYIAIPEFEARLQYSLETDIHISFAAPILSCKPLSTAGRTTSGIWKSSPVDHAECMACFRKYRK